MKRYVTIVILLVASIALIGITEAAEEPRHVILIGWDGVQREHLQQCLKRGELPNLAALASRGAMVDIEVKGTTDTKAGWAQILSGYMPEVSGVYSNRKYQPIPAGYTIFERLKSHFGPEHFAAVAVISKKGNIGAGGPSMNRKAGKMDQGQPYYHTKKNMDLFTNNIGESRKVTKRALKELAAYKERPSFFFIHYGEVDHMGHGHGENSKEYNDAIISCDRELGRLLAGLKGLKEYGNTLIYVTADHGFDEGMTHHKNAPHVFLATNDPLVRESGRREDITPTILQRFGLDLTVIKPPLAGKPLTGPR
jgi:hypothetical protein